MSQAHASPTPSLEITSSCQFSAWLAEQNLSLVFTTYQTAKVFFIGLQPNRLSSIEGVVEELYDVIVLPGVRRPLAIGFKPDEIRRIVTIGSQ